MIEILSENTLDNPLFESITYGVTLKQNTIIRPAEISSHLVFTKGPGHTHAYLVGPWTEATPLTYSPGAEIIWIKLKLGVHLTKTPAVKFKNHEDKLNILSSSEFRLNSLMFNMPTMNDIESFLLKLNRSGVFEKDSLVADVLEGEKVKLSDRGVRSRFLNSIGLSQEHILQIRRVQHAAKLLSIGQPLADVAISSGYYDQPHLTKKFKLLLGVTPGHLRSEYNCQKVQEVQ